MKTKNTHIQPLDVATLSKTESEQERATGYVTCPNHSCRETYPIPDVIRAYDELKARLVKNNGGNNSKKDTSLEQQPVVTCGHCNTLLVGPRGDAYVTRVPERMMVVTSHPCSRINYKDPATRVKPGEEYTIAHPGKHKDVVSYGDRVRLNGYVREMDEVTGEMANFAVFTRIAYADDTLIPLSEQVEFKTTSSFYDTIVLKPIRPIK